MSGLDWSDRGVGWRDATHDEEMASDWLRNRRLAMDHVRLHPRPAGWHDLDFEEKLRLAEAPAGYDDDLDARVLELLQEDLDPERGWRLVLTLLRLADDGLDQGIVFDAVRTFVRNHRDAFYDRIVERLGSEPFYKPFVARIEEGWPGSHDRQEPPL
jgi:hypothetical protein